MVAVIWILLTALLIAVPLLGPRWLLQRALARPLPQEGLATLTKNIPVYARLPAALQQQLQRLVVQFLHQKKFVGCDGLDITDEMRYTIAGQACLLLLNRPTRVYPALQTILVYPTEFLVGRHEVGPGGVITPAQRGLLGESWGDGRVVLAWDHVLRGACDWTDGQNVVLHEFAHQLDSESGAPNGAPFLGSQSSYRSWAAVLSRDYANLRQDAIYRQQSVLDHYGATNPAEFFAVATETFFEKPWQMAANHAELYAELQKYYRVDPREWLPEPVPPPDAQPDWSAGGNHAYAPAAW
jgi:Mlc titration factor MtfA (ptsG expression regulator)